MTGSFSSQEQSRSDTNYKDIRLDMACIWKHRDDGTWMYVEQAAAENLDKPYRQRVYHINEQEDGSFKSEIYTLPDPHLFKGAWKEEHPLDILTPDSLDMKAGCAVFLWPQEDGSFEGGTVGTLCTSGLRGASFATSEVHVFRDSLVTWDRGFDTEGRQVWGATQGGYVFKKLK